MNLILKNKNSLALTTTLIIPLCFFIAGLFGVLDYFIVKALLFLSFGGLFILVLSQLLKNNIKENRPEDKLQDDLN